MADQLQHDAAGSAGRGKKSINCKIIAVLPPLCRDCQGVRCIAVGHSLEEGRYNSTFFGLCMRVFRGCSRPVAAPTMVAIGNFDGVHRGHGALIERLAAMARQMGLVPTVLTFEPHPREFFAPDSAPARLTTLREKLELLADCGVVQVMVCRFNAEFAAFSAARFVDRVLVESLQVRHLIVGDDFRFGQGRQGDFAFLQAAGNRLGFGVESLGSIVVDGERVSSSGVREALAADRRERFIAAALTGIYANPEWPKGWAYRNCAEAAILAADAVIAELEKGQT